MHSVAVSDAMVALGRDSRLDEMKCRAAGLAGLMHVTLGKALMPLDLNKPAENGPTTASGAKLAPRARAR